MNYIFLFFLIFCYKLASNGFYYAKAKKFKKRYEAYIYARSMDTDYDITIEQRSVDIIDLFQHAHIESPIVFTTEPAGYGRARDLSVYAFKNMFADNINIVGNILMCFDTSISYFRKGMNDCFNPLFWVESIIFLPRVIISYLGLDTKSILTRIFQLIYWIIAFIYAVYSNEFNQMIQDFISKLIR